MNDDKLAEFLKFANKYRRKFWQIARATKGEYEPDDVQNEAWLLAKEWELSNAPISFGNPDDLDRLFGCLYNKLVNRTERKIRNGIRLDHYPSGDRSEDEAHPLMNKLAAPESTQPLEMLLRQEAAVEVAREPGPKESRAGAYLYLLQYHNNEMKGVADHLLISLSYCYRRFNEALEMARTQCVLLEFVEKSSSAFFPGPWRPFRLTRIGRPFRVYQSWVQMDLDLGT